MFPVSVDLIIMPIWTNISLDKLKFIFEIETKTLSF